MVGQGRKRTVGDNPFVKSRQKFQCVVCSKELRHDKLIEYYRKFVEFESNGNPVSTFSRQYLGVSDIKKAHTDYFVKINIH